MRIRGGDEAAREKIFWLALFIYLLARTFLDMFVFHAISPTASVPMWRPNTIIRGYGRFTVIPLPIRKSLEWIGVG